MPLRSDAAPLASEVAGAETTRPETTRPETIRPEAKGRGDLLGTAAPTAPSGPLIEPPLPRTATRMDSVVAGFPRHVVRVPTDSKVVSTSLSTTASTVQVSLVATTASSDQAVMSLYLRSLTSLGFGAAAAPATAGSTAAAFSRGRDHLTVTVASPGKRTTFSVFGTLHASGHD